jgi:hypothetical protein
VRYRKLRIDCGFVRKSLIVAAIACFQASFPAAPALAEAFNPAYPRMAARPHGTLISSSAVDADSRHIAKHHVAILATHRTWKGGGFDMATLPAHIKSYNPQVKLFKYLNANQLDGTGVQAWIPKKLYSERGGGGRGDWWKRTTSGNHINGFGAGKYQINVTLQTTPDKSGLQWPQWFVRYWNAAPGDSGSWVAPAGYPKGRGLREGDWDGVFLDDQYISTGVFAPSNADLNNDRLNDPPKDLRTVHWVVAGHAAVVSEWRKVQPSRLVLGQYAALAGESESYSELLAGVHDGALIQDMTRKDRQGGGWPVMMQAYRRSLSLAGGPKIVIFHNNIKDLLNANADMSVYQANRYGLTSALMDNGYYAVMAPGQTRPEFDEFYGGRVHAASKLGYLGYPKAPPQTKAWSQGVYRREFTNGLVLVNPKGNGTRTVSVGSGWRRIDGSQDRNHNNGQSATSVTLKEQDGIILIRR